MSSIGSVASAAAAVVLSHLLIAPATAATKTGYLTIHHMALAPDGDDAATHYANSYSGGISTTSNGACFNTAVNLPQGATISAVGVWYSEDTQAGVAVYLYRQTASVALVTVQPVMSHFTDTSGTPKGTTIPVTSDNVIDNSKYAYAFAACLYTANARFYSARLTYTYTP